ncbi:MAG: methyltransferase [Anaerolineales bacterium]|nr:methyltransferase [Anaerolineales bacterium]
MIPVVVDFPYYQATHRSVQVAGQEITLVSKPGLPGWEQIPPTLELLAGLVHPDPAERILLFGCGPGALAVILSRQLGQGEIWASDINCIAIDMTRHTAAANQIGNLHLLSGIHLTVELQGTFDRAIILLPKGRGLARRWLVQAWNALHSDGLLNLAGANQEGIQSVAKDTEQLFGGIGIMGYKKGCRLIQAQKKNDPSPAPSWLDSPGIAPGTWHEFNYTIGNEIFRLRSLPGVFSFDRLDPGTALLLDHLPDPQGQKVIDVGCGYGIIGLVAAKRGAALVDLVDSSLLATACAAQNLALNHIANARVLTADLLNFNEAEKYNLILSNPPFHTGQAVDYLVSETLILHAHQALLPGGSLVLVANRFLRYNYLMSQVFGNVEILAQTGKFHALKSVASTC